MNENMNGRNEKINERKGKREKGMNEGRANERTNERKTERGIISDCSIFSCHFLAVKL